MAQMLGYEITNYTLTIDGSSIRLVLLNGVAEVLNYASTEAAEVEYDASNDTVRLKIGNVLYVKIDQSNCADIDAGGVAKTLVSEHFDYMEATVDSHNAGGGGSTTIYTELSEAQAITAINNQTLTTGRLYRIELDGSSSGNSGDFVFTHAIGNDGFSREVQYWHTSELQVLPITGIFNENGWAFKSADPTATTAIQPEIVNTDELIISDGSGDFSCFGQWPVDLKGGNKDLVTIVGGFEGMEITIYATGGGAFSLSVLDTGNIVFDQSGFLPAPPITLLDDNEASITLRKRGSNWLVKQIFLQ